MKRIAAIVALMAVLAGCATVRRFMEQPLDRCHHGEHHHGGKHGR